MKLAALIQSNTIWINIKGDFALQCRDQQHAQASKIYVQHTQRICRKVRENNMPNQERELAKISQLRKSARSGDPTAITNAAASYRIVGKHRLAFAWWRKGAARGDGDDLLDLAYCYHHGMGVRQNADEALRSYEQAIESYNVTEFSREEAMYHLAVLLLNRGTRQSIKRAKALLTSTNKDGDYPQAHTLLIQMQANVLQSICVCRRGLRRELATIKCMLHRRKD
jgi:TPR repeat protein